MAANLGGEEGDAALSQSLELASERAEPARLHPRARAAEGAGGVLALDAVDDKVCDGHAFVAQRSEVACALLEGQRFGNRDEDETRACRVEEHRAHALDARREVAQEEVNFVLAPRPCVREVRDHVAVLLRHHVERADPAREDIGQAQHTRGVARRRGVNNDAREARGALDLAQLEEGHHLVHAGKRQVEQVVDVGLVEYRSAVGDLGEHGAVLLFELRERGGGVHLAREEAGRVVAFSPPRDLGRAVADLGVEAVGE